MKEDKFEILLKKYQNGQLSNSERKLLDQWFNSLDSDKPGDWSQIEQENLYKSILSKIDQGTGHSAVKLTRRRWLSYVAVVLLTSTILGLIYQVYFRHNPTQNPTLSGVGTGANQEDILPGGNKATLTLEDGTSLTLSEDYSEIIIREGEIRYDDGSTLLSGDLSDTNVSYATLTVPRGGQYQVLLPDGSKVWLNSASTLKYPIQFQKHERIVELEGEAYFEIAHQEEASGQRIPFLVESSGQTVEVLGTKFNITAYADEQEVRTTLLSGQIRVTRFDTQQSNLLKPGQQSIIGSAPGIEVNTANTEGATAWKSGIFYFEETAFEDMMRPIARWYDIEVQYEGVPPTDVFTGKMSRNVNLSALVNFFKDSGIDLHIEGKKLIVNRKKLNQSKRRNV